MQNIFKNYDIQLNKKQEELFKKFLLLFQEKNAQINLSAIREKEAIIEKHFIDSLILTKYITLSWKIADLGTWGWFPWIPLSIFYQDNEYISFELIDSVRKKIEACNFFIEKLGLKNIEAYWIRAEEKAKQLKETEKYDFIASRAVAYFPKLLTFALPLLKSGWTFIAYKTDNFEEIQEGEKVLKKYSAKIEKIEKYNLWWQERSLIFVKKY